jgi:pilus assembly protein CpaB
MRARTVFLLFLAIILAGSTAMLARSWLNAQRNKDIAEAAPLAPPKAVKSVLVARADLKRGQILRPEDVVWQVWPDGGVDKNYVVMGGPKTPETFAGWVAKNPVGAGEPISDSKVIAPGDRGFLAAVLRPGMRAISVPVTVTSGISGFIFPGDQVDLVLTYQVPSPQKEGDDKKAAYEHKAAETVLRNVRVIGVDQRLESKAGEAVVAHTATFEVTPQQSEVIALASEIGKVALTLRSLVPAPHEVADGPDKVVDLSAGPAPDSPIAESATYTLDSELSPLLPQRANGKASSDGGVVTILRGSGKKEESKASEPASKGS